MRRGMVKVYNVDRLKWYSKGTQIEETHISHSFHHLVFSGFFGSEMKLGWKILPMMLYNLIS